MRRGLGPGDTVCLVMANCPDYLAIWLGLSGIGATVALINTNLRGELLAHSLNLVAPRYVIAGASLAEAVRAVQPLLARGVECWVSGAGGGDLPRLDQAVAGLPGEALLDGEVRAPALTDRALCIYTSGTTGLPKAANVSHLRLMQWSQWFAGLMDVQPGDRMYDCLPLYHSVGGVVATGATLVAGGAVVLRERFSASGFWKDVVDQRCTLFQYIGELCRYLLASPPQAEESRHALRLACGNGLREDVWREFQQRFRIPQILEYYAATEGNFSLYNCEGRPGAIGRIPPFLAHRLPVALVEFDLEAQLPARDATGRCVRCAPHEAGGGGGDVHRRHRSHLADCANTARRASRAILRMPPPPARSCAMCSRPETPGIAPAISCVRTSRDSSTSSTASAIPFAGRARTSPLPRSRGSSRRAPGSRMPPYTE